MILSYLVILCHVFTLFSSKFKLFYNTLTYVNKRTKHFKEPIIKDMNECAFFGVDMLDIWTYASIIFSSKEYKEWYKSKNYKLTKSGYLKTGVEMLTRYLKDNGKFVETHKGQEDLDNEYAIFVSSALLRNDKKLLVNVSGKKTLALARPTKTDKKKGRKPEVNPVLCGQNPKRNPYTHRKINDFAFSQWKNCEFPSHLSTKFSKNA